MTSRVTQLGNQLSSTKMAANVKTDITLYTVNTPNGIKVSILLEELGLDYKVWHASSGCSANFCSSCRNCGRCEL